MQELKTAGLILSATNLNDNDRLYTIQTKEAGKVTAISKGIRSHKHKDFAALQNFCYSDMVLSRKTGLYYVSSANIINNFYGIRNSVEQMSFAAYFADVIKSFPEELPLEEDYFNFVLNTLYLTGKALEKCKNGDVAEYLNRLKCVFEFKTVCYAGFMPSLEECEVCGSVKDIEYFDIASGCVICKNCHDRYIGEPVKVTQSVIKLLKFMENADLKSVFAYNGSVEDVRLISQITEKYMINSLEIFPTSLTYLKTTVGLEG